RSSPRTVGQKDHAPGEKIVALPLDQNSGQAAGCKRCGIEGFAPFVQSDAVPLMRLATPDQNQGCRAATLRQDKSMVMDIGADDDTLGPIGSPHWGRLRQLTPS